eukprot:gene48054-3759_t
MDAVDAAGVGDFVAVKPSAVADAAAMERVSAAIVEGHRVHAALAGGNTNPSPGIGPCAWASPRRLLALSAHTGDAGRAALLGLDVADVDAVDRAVARLDR